ncbi:MAG TPA: carboxypeptidase regulatory-like domain-containing protein, partial [Vicinamibacterales bacterium]|nr:carboxypeptidase regulatory-like domain-containing protein [Vicinamibacterales bacterium]
GVESLWNSHTVGASGPTSSQAAARYYEVRVTGGTVSNATQAFTYSPDGSVHRFMPSTAVDRAGNMAFGYSATNTALFPAIRYAGRLAGDPINTITQTETSLFAGTGSQSGNCGGSSCERWGDYSTMTVDPNGCTFWYTNEYYQASGLNYRTRIGAFAFPSCVPVTVGTLQGTVTNSSAVPIAGATVSLGSRTTTTDGSGNYSFADIAPGTYPSATASAAGHQPSTATAIDVPSGGTATRDFVLTAAPQSGCLTDTTQAHFQAGSSTNCDATSSPGDVKLAGGAGLDQQAVFPITGDGVVFDHTFWTGQTFVPSVSGPLMQVDIDLFCFTCSGTMPDITVSIRATNGAVPIGGDLATATIPGFTDGAGGFFSAVFASPPALTAGTRYAIVVRAASEPFSGLYVAGCSCSPNTNPYAAGQFIDSTNNGVSWTADAAGRDLGFRTHMQAGFAPSGTFTSSLKDANPVAGATVTWGALSWNATVPAGTTVQLRAAASNNINGPFTFVGPDGTAGTSFTNGASLAQFNGNRYLKYQATLTTSDSTVTPAIHDVTICFNNAVAPPPTSPTATLDSNAVTFSGKRKVGTTSPPANPVTITNNGPGNLLFASFNGAAPSASFTVGSDFPATTNCPLVAPGLAPGGSCQFTFRFAPVAAGPRNATLTIATNASNSPHSIALSGVAFVLNNATVTATVSSGGTRLHQLQNADGGWYFAASDTDCGTNAFPAGSSGSCKNIIGVTGLGLLSAFDRTGDASRLADAIAAGDLLEAIHTALPAEQPFSQDLEFLRALAAASGDASYSTLAQQWFGTVTAAYPVAADKVDAQFASRGLLFVWDIASLIRSAKAAGQADYARALGQRVVALEPQWRNIDPSLTTIGMGSFLWAVHDLPGFNPTIAS